MASGYQNPRAQYKAPTQIEKLQGQVNEVTSIMRDNIDLELQRGAKLDDLEAKADILSSSSQMFSERAKVLKRKYWWKNVKMWIILIVIAIILITIIVLASVLGTKKKT